MGEMADLFIDHMLDAYGEWSPFAYDEHKPHKVTCKRCGAQNLEWDHDGRKWYLIDKDGNPHVCKQMDAASDFD